MVTPIPRLRPLHLLVALAIVGGCTSVDRGSGPSSSPLGVGLPVVRSADAPRATPTRTIPPRDVHPPDSGSRSVRRPLPAPSASLPPRPLALSLYEHGDFVSQARVDWCVPAAILTMINLIDPVPAAALSPPGQADLDRLARSLSTDRLVGAGSEPEGWAGALNELGYGPYEVRAEPTRDAALEVAARALRSTGRPVGLLIWRGAHAWVLSGFEATADPLATSNFEVTHVRVQDPWHPRVSSIWGPAQRPDSRIAVAKLAEDYLPWRRPTVRYPEKDGRFVLVLPTTGPAG